jgi:hypothetical protein
MTPEIRKSGTARAWYTRFPCNESARDNRELLKAIFSLLSAPRLYSEDQREKLVSGRPESVVSCRELQVSSGSPWLAIRNHHVTSQYLRTSDKRITNRGLYVLSAECVD